MIISLTLISWQLAVHVSNQASTAATIIVGLLTIIVGLFTAALAYLYDRGRRYNYLADRWNDLMNINNDEPDFFDPEKTNAYMEFEQPKKTKYIQYSRMYWGLVEDAIRNDYLLERYLKRIKIEPFVDAYSDTIRECIRLHHAWLEDNLDSLFTYKKFRQELSQKFASELATIGVDLKPTDRRPL